MVLAQKKGPSLPPPLNQVTNRSNVQECAHFRIDLFLLLFGMLVRLFLFVSHGFVVLGVVNQRVSQFSSVSKPHKALGHVLRAGCRENCYGYPLVYATWLLCRRWHVQTCRFGWSCPLRSRVGQKKMRLFSKLAVGAKEVHHARICARSSARYLRHSTLRKEIGGLAARAGQKASARKA